MGEHDRQVNQRLASWLVDTCLEGRPGRTLDIGAKYPFLAHCLRNLGCHALALDNIEAAQAYGQLLDVPMLLGDFEMAPDDLLQSWAGHERFRLVTLIHVFEHLYDPRAALRRLRTLVADDGALFLRLPDHGVTGYERDMDPGHYTIHPYYHCLETLQKLLELEPGLFQLTWTAPMEGAGQRDVVLRPVPQAEGPALRPRLALVRPGALGDVVMTLNLVPALRRAHPGHDIHYFCAEAIGEALGPLLAQAGVDRWHDVRAFDGLKGEYRRSFNLVGYPLAEGYPEKPMGHHLLHYFAAELGLEDVTWPRLALARPAAPVDGGPYATLHPTALWSAYKNWPLDRWEAVLEACPDIPVYQIGSARDPRVRGARHDFLGRPLMDSVALLANARLHLGVDSFTNHLTHYHWDGQPVPAVILWGSTQWDASGYPHNANLSLGLGCQPCFREDPALSAQSRGPCVSPPGQSYEAPRHACMAGLTVDRVTEAVRRRWEDPLAMVAPR